MDEERSLVDRVYFGQNADQPSVDVGDDGVRLLNVRSPLATCGMIRTKKDAKAKGLKTYDEWLRNARWHGNDNWLAPRHDALGVEVKGVRYYSIDDCEELVSRPRARKYGLVIPDEATAVTERCNEHSVYYPLFRVSECRPLRRREIPPRHIDLLTAVFKVTKAANRCYELSHTHYFHRSVSLSDYYVERKEALLDLKDRGIAEAWKTGRLRLVEIYERFAIYRGDRHCFRSPFLPAEYKMLQQIPDDSMAPVQSAPKAVLRARLKDAIHTLEQLPEVGGGFVRTEWTEEMYVEDDPFFFDL